MIGLLVDGLTALVKLTDRGLTAALDMPRRPVTPPTVDDDAWPAGVAPETGTGGHPIRDTSDLLSTAAGYMRVYRVAITHTGHGPYIEALDDFIDELHDRAASLAAVGD